MIYGYENTDDDTFDVIYSLTVIRTAAEGQAQAVNTNSSRRKLISSVGCVYVVSAAGAAQPDIRVEEYNGALCMWSRVPGVGENFLIDYTLPF
eukprot:CAMPEP_0202692330 /NCGR_PEP_ID=MMETSP1385-20130828/6734_1 /ASSEMBLY_ACC=CAM_ASM_000861 /TAXON_ID=933848 /ORGANISM="Elphidium margaritaceum" /LENGTH=92 /DNA_ID=CAMNT_0049347841 /DNA_START=250 /DNA_END=528 /DNA_ORIENTATION=+